MTTNRNITTSVKIALIVAAVFYAFRLGRYSVMPPPSPAVAREVILEPPINKEIGFGVERIRQSLMMRSLTDARSIDDTIPVGKDSAGKRYYEIYPGHVTFTNNTFLTHPNSSPE